MENTSAQARSTSVKTISPQSSGAKTQDAALIAQACAGDRKALDALLVAARPRALAVARKVLHSPDDAEDAVQEAFVKVWRYIHRFEGRASFSTWVHRIVMNASLDFLRRGSCRPEARGDEADALPGVPDVATVLTPERQFEQRQTVAYVHAALHALSPVHRQVLTLRELEERSYQEIADASGCPVGTVMSRLHHARRRLAESLGEGLGPQLCAA